MHELALAVLLAVAGGGNATASGAGGAKSAALPCASPHLPAAILAGANAAVSGDVSATPLPVVTVAAPGAPLTLAVASDGRARELGLMCVTALRPGAGMLFVFDGDDEWSFWMKNTVIALDMVWVRGDGTVTRVASNVPASTLETPSERVARRSGFGTYVIELRSGGASASHLAVGTHLAVPETEAAR